MNEPISLLVAIMTMWVVIAGIAYMVGGPTAARAVFVRPVRWAVPRLVMAVRRAVSWALVTLGQWIRG